MGRHTKEPKKIRVIETDINYSGNRSPYWDYLRDAEGPTHEIDDLSERKAMYPERSLTSEQEFRLFVIRVAWDLLTPAQKRVVHLVGERGLSEEAASRELEMTKGALHSILMGARKKIEKVYEKIKSEEAHSEKKV